MPLMRLPRVMFEPLVRTALLEDLGQAGDLTTDAIVPADTIATMALAARQPGVIAGLDIAAVAFELIDPNVEVTVVHPDGSTISAGDVVATLRGPARALLTAERTALNLLCHLSGIATQTAVVVKAVRDHKAKIVCTRKTSPGLRALEKYAVRAGGGANHRYGLDDAVLIKDNHIAIAGDISEAIKRACAGVGHMVKIEVEVDTLEQLEAALVAGVDAVLLDNMCVDQLTKAVAMVDGCVITEASGRVSAQTASAIAATGVDLISVGWITHSAPILDIGLDWVRF